METDLFLTNAGSACLTEPSVHIVGGGGAETLDHPPFYELWCIPFY